MRVRKILVFCATFLSRILVILGGEGTLINPIQFPIGGPFMGIFLALALPLELPNLNIFVSYNFEANYVLPENQTRFTYPPIIGDENVGRKSVYRMLEQKLIAHGYNGKPCILRAICEAAEYSSQYNGILGDIVHIVLTPSSSINNKLEKDYEDAENYGKTKLHCKKYAKKCSFSVLNLISWIGHIVENNK